MSEETEAAPEVEAAPAPQYPCLRRMKIAYLMEHLLPDNPRVITAVEYEQLKRQLDDGDTGNLQPISFNVRTEHVIAGNQRVSCYDDLGVEETDVWCVDISEEAQRRAVLALNNHAGRYDDLALKEMLATIAEDAAAKGEDQSLAFLSTGFTTEELAQIMADAKPPASGPDTTSPQEQARATLAERFLIPPFSVLDARQGYWQSRKNGWIALGLKGEEGRGGNLIGRSPQELFMFNTRIPYDEARKIVLAEMEEKGDAFDLMELIKRHTNQPVKGFEKVGAVIPPGRGGSMTQNLVDARNDAKAAIPGGAGKTSVWLGKDGDGKGISRKDSTLGAIPSNEQDILNGEGSYARGKGKQAARTFGQDLMRGEHVVGGTRGGLQFAAKEAEAGDPAEANNYTGTSIFDPVLCEVAYYWFCPPGGSILDPFSGGSTRGAVAGCCGHAYTGVDLSERQIAANRQQWPAIADAARGILPGAEQKLSVVPAPVDPQWVQGDSTNMAELTGSDAETYDMIFSCPPYADLEVYSDHPADISNMKYPEFVPAYRKIIAEAVRLLKPNRFACFVVGDLRDEKGFYRGFVPDTIHAFEDAGARLYNEIVLVTAIGSLPIRGGRQFAGFRKVGKTHQNVLVFFKGDPQTIKGWPAHAGQAITEEAVEALVPKPEGDAEPSQEGAGAAVAGFELPLEQRAEEANPDALTPVYPLGDFWVKRDDLFTCNGAPGGKVRSCLRLARRAQAEGKEGLVTAGSRSSPQVNIVARVAASLGLKARCHTPTGKLSPEVVAAQAAGAEIVQHRAGYNNVIIARAREDAAARGWAEIPFGMECPEAIQETRQQVANIPAECTRLVIPCGSGMSLSGVLHGLDDIGRGDLPVVAVVVGADPTERLDKYAPKNWRERVTLQPSGSKYDQGAPVTRLVNMKLDGHYEAKCLPFLAPGDLFWVVGIRSTAVAGGAE